MSASAEPYRIDPDDPRAPTMDLWNAMSRLERAAVVEALPALVPLELSPPEGDVHRRAKGRATDTLDAFFRRTGKKIYVSSEINVYYPGESRFAPDVLAVRDVGTHDRTKWVVTDDGKGLDFVMEVHYLGDRRKDFRRNVEWFARLGIEEYFVFDARNGALRGFRLAEATGRSYLPILAQQGLYSSQVLGLDLRVEDGSLRLYYGQAPLPDAEELIAKLGHIVDHTLQQQRDAEARADAEAARADAEAARAAEQAASAAEQAARADAAEARVRELEAEVAALRR